MRVDLQFRTKYILELQTTLYTIQYCLCIYIPYAMLHPEAYVF